jgi:hypothetical protein
MRCGRWCGIGNVVVGKCKWRVGSILLVEDLERRWANIDNGCCNCFVSESELSVRMLIEVCFARADS